MSFVYEFRVPGKSIRFRAKVPVTGSGKGTNSSFGLQGYRTNARAYTAFVSALGPGTWEFDKVRIRYELPTAYNKRRCVTPGECLGQLGTRRAAARADLVIRPPNPRHSV